MNFNFWLEKRTIIALALSMLALAEIIDLTIVAVALPDIMGALGANFNEISLTITSYIVAAAIFIPLTGVVTAKFGMKKIILISAVLFGVSSILCGIATSVTEMVIFRLFQGIGGAFLPSLSQGYIMTKFKDEELNKMMTVYSLCVVLGPIIGPIMGGAISEHLSWQWIFYVNVPLCILAFLLIFFLMPNDEAKPSKIDLISFFYMAVGIGFLEYFIDEGNQNNWLEAHESIIFIAIAIIGLSFFIWRGINGKSVVNFSIFKYKNYVLSCFAVFTFMAIITSTLSYFPTLLQQGYGFPVDTAGYITTPRGIAAFVAAPIFMYLSKKIDSRMLLVAALILFVISTYGMSSFSVVHNNVLIITTAVIQGMALIGFFILLIPLSYVNMPENLNNDASGLFNFFRNFGSSVGTSIGATIISQQGQVSWHDMVKFISKHNLQYHNFVSKLPIVPHLAAQYAPQIAALQIKQQAFLISNLDIFVYAMYGVVLLIWVPFALHKLKKPTPGFKFD